MTALVTGGSRGIGAACVKALSLDGYSVFLNYRASKEAAERVASQTGSRAICADVSDPAAVLKMLEETGDIDVLVCCAGISHYGLFTDMTNEQCRSVLETNIGGVINCCRAAVPGMILKKSGCIITLSSIWGLSGASCEVVYSASKAAVIGFSKALAKELGSSGIRVNCIAPGVIKTDMLKNFTQDDLSELRDKTPLDRLGTPEDIANLVSFLASEKSSFITGQVICSDGGFLG